MIIIIKMTKLCQNTLSNGEICVLIKMNFLRLEGFGLMLWNHIPILIKLNNFSNELQSVCQYTQSQQAIEGIFHIGSKVAIA